MKLFYSPGACSRVVHIALEDAGATYEPVVINTRDGSQRTPEYLAINPKGRVPALQTERGVLTEVLAILTYIALAYPAAKLAPLDDPFAFAEIQSLNGFLASSVHVAFAHRFRTPRYIDDVSAHPAMHVKALAMLDEYFAILEHRMVGPWAMGEVYTIADPYLFVMESWLAREGFSDIKPYPKLAAHEKRMLDLPNVQKIIAREEAARRN